MGSRTRSKGSTRGSPPSPTAWPRNRDSLATNADSLARVADSTAAMAERLRSGVIEASLDDIQAVIGVILFLLVAWTSVPALGALGVGLWLRRELRGPTAGQTVPVA